MWCMMVVDWCVFCLQNICALYPCEWFLNEKQEIQKCLMIIPCFAIYCVQCGCCRVDNLFCCFLCFNPVTSTLFFFFFSCVTFLSSVSHTSVGRSSLSLFIFLFPLSSCVWGPGWCLSADSYTPCVCFCACHFFFWIFWSILPRTKTSISQ